MKNVIIVIALSVLLPPTLLGAAPEAVRARPNIVLIFTDDQGFNDVGCYGSEIPTPHIDRLAAQGVRFTSWYSASSICTPSRFGLLTGRNPSRSRSRLLSALMFLGEEDAGRGIQPGETTIAEVLREKAGYQTALIGKWHLGHGAKEFLPTRHGFERFTGHTGGCIDYFTMTYGILPDWYHQEKRVGENGYATELISEEATRYLASRKDAKEPFFLYLAYNAPHFGKGWSPADGKPVNLMQPQAADLRRVAFIEDKIRREFAAMVVSLDDGVGRVLDAIDANGLTDDTLVIFLTDHGGDPVYGGSNKPLRGEKATLFEGGVRVPCIMRWPGRIDAGAENGEARSSLDLFPTFCRLAGVDAASYGVDGLDALDAMTGARVDPSGTTADPATDREFYWETGTHALLERGAWTALRRGKWKYVESPSEGEFLFDLAADPNEDTNLALVYPEVLARLRERRDALTAEYAGQ